MGLPDLQVSPSLPPACSGLRCIVLFKLEIASRSPQSQGCRNGRFGKRCFCPLPKTGGLDENRRKVSFCIPPTKKKRFCSSEREIDENDENDGRHPGKMTVFQKHRFDNLDNQQLIKIAMTKSSTNTIMVWS